MEADPATPTPQPGDGGPSARAPRLRVPAFIQRLPRLLRAQPPFTRRQPRPDAGTAGPERRAHAWRRFRPSPLAVSLCALAIAVVFVAAVTYYGARQFSRRATDGRGAGEAISFARHSGTLATGEAFDGYIQMLRFADDPVVSAKGSPHEARVAALRQLLYLNVNKFASLTIADRSGLALATTDPAIVSVGTSATFSSTRANLSPANSDVLIPQPGATGYIEYTAPLKDRDGTVWGVLLGRADPARIWRSTLSAQVDGSRNVIINSDGLFAAGVPQELLGTPWHGAAVGNGVAATIAGVPSICGLSPIGRDTQMDRGLSVASCLPSSVIQAERGQAMGKQGLVTLAAGVLAMVLGGGLVLLFGRTPAGAVASAPVEHAAPQPVSEAPDALPAPDAVEPSLAPPPAPAAAEVPDDAGTEPEPASPLVLQPHPGAGSDAEEAPTVERAEEPVAVAAADALALIDAYEQRNARLAERLREAVQAPLLVATAQAGEAYRLARAEGESDDHAAADSLHARALDDLTRLQEQELRAVGQELHPTLIRLGLPAALRSLAKEHAGTLAVGLEVDAAADSVGQAAGRATIPAGQRLALYRFAAEALRALAEAGAQDASLSLQRAEASLALRVTAEFDPRGEDIGPELFAACAAAAAAYGGAVSVVAARGTASLEMTLPAAEAEAAPEVDLAAFEASLTAPDAADRGDDGGETGTESEQDDAPHALVHVVTLGAERDRLSAALQGLRQESPAAAVTLELEGDIDAAEPAQADAVLSLARTAVERLAAAGATACTLSLRRDDGALYLELAGDTDGAAFDAAPVDGAAAAFEALGGYVSVSRRGATVHVSGELPPAAPSGSQDAA